MVRLIRDTSQRVITTAQNSRFAWSAGISCDGVETIRVNFRGLQSCSCSTHSEQGQRTFSPVLLSLIPRVRMHPPRL
jgi:hypothetical protein